VPLVDKDKAIVKSLLKWHRENRRVFPWRGVRDPYRVFIAEFFLQRTPANRVATIFPKFIEEFPSSQKLAHADLVQLETIYRSLGLKKRMSWLVESMKIICEKYSESIPDTQEGLMELPGVGEYTASATLCFGFGHHVPIVDANIIRILTRVFYLPETHRIGNITIKEIAKRILSTNQAVAYNEALLDLAALICKKRPLCNCCPLRSLCAYNREHRKNLAGN